MESAKKQLAEDELAEKAWSAVIRQPKEQQIAALEKALVWAKRATLSWEEFELLWERGGYN